MSTERLYEQDSHLLCFTASLLRCEQLENGRVSAVLDRTAFFPEGGGQKADTGMIGDSRVLDVHIRDGEIIHILSSMPSVPAGGNAVLPCAVDAEQRLRRMQNHSGEHIVSGLVHRLYGFENVGFHMGTEAVTIDFSGPLTWEQLLDVERQANEAVRADLPVKAWLPSAEELAGMEYRSKLELTEHVRIVEIEGIDRCACCAPHVKSTGEIGSIKLLSCERHRGGVRVSMVCGMDARDVFNALLESAGEISSLLSAKREEIAPAVEHLLTERDELKFRKVGLERELIAFLAETIPIENENALLIRQPDLSDASRRELVNLLVPRCGGLAAVFSGSDEDGYQYIIGSRSRDLRTAAKEINTALSGRGGGKPEMITGFCSASALKIKDFFADGGII